MLCEYKKECVLKKKKFETGAGVSQASGNNIYQKRGHKKIRQQFSATGQDISERDCITFFRERRYPVDPWHYG